MLTYIAAGIIVVALARWLAALITGEWGDNAGRYWPVQVLLWPGRAALVLAVGVMITVAVVRIGVRKAMGKAVLD